MVKCIIFPSSRTLLSPDSRMSRPTSVSSQIDFHGDCCKLPTICLQRSAQFCTQDGPSEQDLKINHIGSNIIMNTDPMKFVEVDVLQPSSSTES